MAELTKELRNVIRVQLHAGIDMPADVALMFIDALDAKDAEIERLKEDFRWYMKRARIPLNIHRNFEDEDRVDAIKSQLRKDGE